MRTRSAGMILLCGEACREVIMVGRAYPRKRLEQAPDSVDVEGDWAREAARRAAMRRLRQPVIEGETGTARTVPSGLPQPAHPTMQPSGTALPNYYPAAAAYSSALYGVPPPPPAVQQGTERGLRWLRLGVIAHIAGVLIPLFGGIASLVGFGYGLSGFWEMYKDRRTLGGHHARSASLSLYCYMGAAIAFVLSFILPIVVFFMVVSSPGPGSYTTNTGFFVVLYVLLYALFFQGLIALGRYLLLRELVDLKGLPLLVIASMTLVVTSAIATWLQFSASFSSATGTFFSFLLIYYLIGLFQLVPYSLYYMVIRAVEERVPRLRWEMSTLAQAPPRWPVPVGPMTTAWHGSR